MCEWLPVICALLVVIEFHFCRDVTLVVNVASYALIAIEMSGSPVLVFLFTFLEWKGREWRGLRVSALVALGGKPVAQEESTMRINKTEFGPKLLQLVWIILAVVYYTSSLLHFKCPQQYRSVELSLNDLVPARAYTRSASAWSIIIESLQVNTEEHKRRLSIVLVRVLY